MDVKELLTALWPLVAFQIILAIAALISISRRGETKKLPKLAWILIVILVNTVGPILYFIIGKGELRDGEQYRD
ncbi:MAG: PLD nuclease N-terminal domain-containing protein [Bacillota bacterium]